MEDEIYFVSVNYNPNNFSSSIMKTLLNIANLLGHLNMMLQQIDQMYKNLNGI